MEEIFKLIDRYGVTLGMLIYMIYRDHRFLRKWDSMLDRIAAALGEQVDRRVTNNDAA